MGDMGSEETTPEKIEDDFEIPKMPSEDWEMTVFLNKLADELTSEDLKKMKSLLKGMYQTGIRVLEEIKDPLDFFQHLRHRRVLTRDNIIVLQALIWHICRRDLHFKIVEFSSNLGNVVHFYHTKDEPLNGFEYIQFHVAGKEKMNRHKLEELRSLVARLVCVPPHFVLAAGIESTNSVFVTFMIPEGYSNILLDMKQSEKEYLGSKGVDTVVIDGHTIKCTDQPYTEEGIIKDEEIKLLLEQESNYKKEIDEQQILLLKKDRQIRQYASKMKEIKAKADWKIFEVSSRLIEEYVELKHTPKNLSLRAMAAQNAEKVLKDQLEKAAKLGYDKKFLSFLLDSNTACIITQQESYHGAIQANLNSRIHTLQTHIAKLAYERDKMAYFRHGDVSTPVLTENEEFFLQVLSLPFPFLVAKQTITIKTEKGTIDLETGKKVFLELLTKMESYLDKDHREILRREFLSSKQDLQCYSVSKLALLHHLWNREVEKKGWIGANFQEWMVKILATIKRMDLYDKWVQLSNEIFERATSQFKESEGCSQKDQARQSRKEMKSQTSHDSSEQENRVTGKRGNKKKDSAKSEDAGRRVTEARLERMEETLKRLENLFMDILSKENTKNAFLDTPNPNHEIQYNWGELSKKLFITY